MASGASVIATSSSDEKLKLASKLGAKHLINYKTTPDWEEAVKTIVSGYLKNTEGNSYTFLRQTNGRGVDHVIEVRAIGPIASWRKGLTI